MSGFAFLHCSQKVFSDYGYPNLHCINLQTTLLEKHVKDVSCSRYNVLAKMINFQAIIFYYHFRTKYGVLWSVATCVYLFGVLGSHCVGLAMANLSISLIGLDIGLSLAFVLFGRLKYVSALVKCHQSTPTHCSNKDLSSSNSIRDNSISILSESSKTFLTLPGQISLSKMLDSPKIYPSPHRSSSTYGRNCNPSSHLYESPKHLYKYEFDRYLYKQNGCSNTNSAYNLSSNPTRNSMYSLRANSRLVHGSSLEPNPPIVASPYVADTECAPPINSHFARTSSMVRAQGPAHAFRSRFFDRDNFISLN